jgi:hypothetical protein
MQTEIPVGMKSLSSGVANPEFHTPHPERQTPNAKRQTPNAKRLRHSTPELILASVREDSLLVSPAR